MSDRKVKPKTSPENGNLPFGSGDKQDFLHTYT